ncbi:MAG: TonB-dependent receptor [Deltaproteobacteria bacterium]|nr:TonB-dependent receptor [Candidatus Deferrimicrobium borealis]
MKKFPFPYLLGFLAMAAWGFPPFSRPALAETCDPPIAVAVSVQGDVKVKHGKAGEWLPVGRKDAFCPGDILRVMERSRADLLLMNETTLRLDQTTEIAFSAPAKEKDTWLDLLLGGAYFLSRTPRRFKVGTPFVNAGIEGTEFFIRAESDKTLVTVFEGRVTAANDRGSVTLDRGQSAEASVGQAPVLRAVAHPRDAVQWTLYYPAVVAPRAGAAQDWRERAAALLAVGRADEAQVVIDEALKNAPGDADALALQAVIAVARNEKGTASELGKKAVAANPESATARVALSYAQQANFDLEGALSSVQAAVRSEPGNALARARLSELLLSFGRLDEALDEAQKASAQNPGIARTQTVLGFAYLAQVKTRDSRDAFERAIGLDQADPLPRLGLGLATIRDGDVQAGREEIAIAASLDPNSSLIRSYLGKAYYEEKRGKTASTQFTMAKELDPSDPTPYFYDAILKQSLNRPVEALQDLQKSISLNDNRAVYRSRLLLDEDLAARSASLGRIYDDLGFQQLALVEGWKSVNTDPANFSAHRFLADSYAALPRHEVARASELLQSQLLQPININPVQPQFAESKRLILGGTGPASPSFNEFSPLFNRNRLALQASGVVGNQKTAGDEVVLSGLWNRFSGSVGQYHYETDGFRTNNDLTQNIYNVFTQASLSHKTSVLAEYRAFDGDHGDLELDFLTDDFFKNIRYSDQYKGGRVGVHHAFAPGSDFIGTMVYELHKYDAKLKDQFPFDVGVVLDLDVADQTSDHVVDVELQQILRRGRYQLVAGAGYLHVNRDATLSVSQSTTPPVFPPDVQQDSLDSTVDHTNAYLYLHVRYPESATWTVGGSADFFRDSADVSGVEDRNQFNPKFGVTWTPRPGTTVRGAVFRVLRRTLPFTSQTIEPTQVAGFNQFYDDLAGTDAWTYGAGADQKITDSLFAGVEYFQRDLDVPISVTVPPAPTTYERFDWKERQGRAYVNWTPDPRWALSADYLYERQDRELHLVKEVRTHRVPLSARFFHPSGVFATATGTWFDQSGEFFRNGEAPSTATPTSGSDRFWIVDASVGYRLPDRWGIVSIEARNLFDRSFQYQDTDPVRPIIQPGRTVYIKATLSL